MYLSGGCCCLWGRLTGSHSRKKRWIRGSWSGGRAEARLANTTAFHSPFVCAVNHAPVLPPRSISLAHTQLAHAICLIALLLLFLSPCHPFVVSVHLCVCVCGGGSTLVRVHIRGRVGSCSNPESVDGVAKDVFIPRSVWGFFYLPLQCLYLTGRGTLSSSLLLALRQHLGIQWWIWLQPATRIPFASLPASACACTHIKTSGRMMKCGLDGMISTC